ncbi:hypothetical protein PGTUg99_015194 [Puccinia graminis f. sp. tritici]|uniref:Uncharacterized protein n=1 Tax=Puccinia graminis f. sp. tritici TaxID=56615 RepID=A0A5B0R842_PUCGR|nr:hypothetical protein PGTUg99_015194 [Puccinia graminis f. sp. tritici]
MDKNLTIDDMTEKLKQLDELETNLLPSTKELIDQLLVALDIKGSSNYSQPDLDLTLEILSKLDKNLKRTVHIFGLLPCSRITFTGCTP